MELDSGSSPLRFIELEMGRQLDMGRPTPSRGSFSTPWLLNSDRNLLAPVPPLRLSALGRNGGFDLGGSNALYGGIGGSSALGGGITEARRLQLLQRVQMAELQMFSALEEMRLVREELMQPDGPAPFPSAPRRSFNVSGSSWNQMPLWSSGDQICRDCGSAAKTYFDSSDKNWYCAKCWYECYQEWPLGATESECGNVPRVILGYTVYPFDVLGRGGFSVVRRGRLPEAEPVRTAPGEAPGGSSQGGRADASAGSTEVAVKTYAAMEGDLDPESRTFFLEKFRHEVKTFQRLHSKEDVGGQIQGGGKRASWFIPEGLKMSESPKMMDIFEGLPESSELFVRLIDFSKDSLGQPGPDISGECCVVLELAEYTLNDFLGWRHSAGTPLSMEEVRSILLQLSQVMAVLHAKQFVHCDLKPMNIMHFPSGRWKLIDMDGMVTSGKDASLGDVFYTPIYCSPEFAHSVLKSDDGMFHVSRLLDVWSLGMIAVELVTLEPVLAVKHSEFEDTAEAWESGTTFLHWLSNPTSVIDLPLAALDAEFADLCRRMVERSTELRASMIEVLLHPFFTGTDGLLLVAEKGAQQQALSDFRPSPDERRGSRLKQAQAVGTVCRRRVSLQVVDPPSKEMESIRRIPGLSPSSAFSDVSAVAPTWPQPRRGSADEAAGSVVAKPIAAATTASQEASVKSRLSQIELDRYSFTRLDSRLSQSDSERNPFRRFSQRSPAAQLRTMGSFGLSDVPAQRGRASNVDLQPAAPAPQAPANATEATAACSQWLDNVLESLGEEDEWLLSHYSERGEQAQRLQQGFAAIEHRAAALVGMLRDQKR